MNSLGTFLRSRYFLIFFVSVQLLVAAASYLRLRKCKRSSLSPSTVQAFTSPDASDAKSSSSNEAVSKAVKWYQQLFYQIQNLECHSEVLESARDELLAMFSRSISSALQLPRTGIFQIERYNAKEIWRFIENEQKEVLEDWRCYLERRSKGCGPELFATVEAAKEWLVQQAPTKLVDGAWLAHTHKITTPFALRGITKHAWQVLSEEFGDGDLSKHHVHLYRQLLKAVGQPLPDAHSLNFIKSHHWDRLQNRDVWEAAVGQLLISLFPNEFLPEILGFNMHYELITLDTMRAAHELKAIHLDPYYFLIHLSIDNADSGHTAMATHTVTRYLDMVRATEGEIALEQAWRRVQVGYTLSQTLGSSPAQQRRTCVGSSTRREHLEASCRLVNPLSAGVIEIFKAKASVSHGFHCQSRVRIGEHTLAEWLSPKLWSNSNSSRHLELLTALSHSKPWIWPGDSSRSLFIREISWRGRMFGAFTNAEVVTLTTWIDALSPEGSDALYWKFTQRDPIASKVVVGELQDPARDHPVVSTCDLHETDIESWESNFLHRKLRVQKLSTLSLGARLPDLIALWFAHIGLLENTINTPSRTATPIHASIIRLLRAQAGFAVETHNVAGMDEMKRPSSTSLVDIGLELTARTGWRYNAKVGCLQDVFHLTASRGQSQESSCLAREILCWSTRPSTNLGWLLGVAFAFLELKSAVVKVPGLLTQATNIVLEAIVAREKESLEVCVRELQCTDVPQYQSLIRGYNLGSKALESCLYEC